MSFVFYVLDQGAKEYGNKAYLIQAVYFILFWILLKFFTSGDGISNAQPFLGYYLFFFGTLLAVRFNRRLPRQVVFK